MPFRNCCKVQAILGCFSKKMSQKHGNGGKPWVGQGDRGKYPTCSAQKSRTEKPDPILMVKQCHEVKF